jgi:hypothetical protein
MEQLVAPVVWVVASITKSLLLACYVADIAEFFVALLCGQACAPTLIRKDLRRVHLAFWWFLDV